MTTPIFVIDEFDSTSDLLERRTRLSLMQNIGSMQAYAQEWATLAADFEVCGLLSNAEYCRERAKHYAEMPAGEYVRLVDQPVAELIYVG